MDDQVLRPAFEAGEMTPSAEAFAPPAIRRQRIPTGPSEPNGNGNGHAKAEGQTLSQNAAMVAQGIEDLQKERDRLKDELHRANARIEQFTSNETRILSEIEGERARTAEAKAEAEHHRGEVKRLETVVGSIVNMGHDALTRP